MELQVSLDNMDRSVDFEALYGIKSEYVKVHFRIRSAYRWGDGYSKEDKAAFNEESRRLFTQLGWQLLEGASSSRADTVTNGLQQLYLHPMDFSGEILEESIQPINAALDTAKTFSCYGVDCYERCFTIEDAEYQQILETQKDTIVRDLLERYKTKRSNLYMVGDGGVTAVSKKYAILRMADRDKHDNLALAFAIQLFNQLVEQGDIVSSKTKSGIGYRTATKNAKKKEL